MSKFVSKDLSKKVQRFEITLHGIFDLLLLVIVDMLSSSSSSSSSSDEKTKHFSHLKANLDTEEQDLSS